MSNLVTLPGVSPSPNPEPPRAPTAPSSSAIDPTAPLPALSQLARTAILLFFVGFSAAIAAQLAFNPDLASFVWRNAMPSADRRVLLNVAGGAGLLACVVPAIYLALRPSRATVERIARAARIASPLLLSFALPLFFDWQVFRDHELLCVLSATIFGLALERTLRLSFSSLDWTSAKELSDAARIALPRLTRWLPRIAVAGLAIFFGVYFSYYTVLHHYRLQTQSWDLAIYDNIMWNLIRGKWFKTSPNFGPWGSHIHDHASFGAYFFAPLYALRQRADTLLVLQAVISGAGAIPLYLLVKRRLASAWLGVLFAYAYVVYAPLHGPVFYDFHFLTTAPFWISWVLYFFETRSRGWLLVAWIGAVLLREDQSAGLAMACFFYVLSGDRPKVAIVGGILSAVYFVLVKFVVMPMNKIPMESGEAFTWIFSGLIPTGEGGFGAVLRTVVSNPLYTLGTLVEQDKLAYLMKMLAPVLFLPLRNTRAWILIVPPAMFTLLATGYKPVIETYFQYTSNWTAYLFFASAITLATWRSLPDGGVRIASAACALAITSTALSYNHGAIFQHHTFRGGFRHVEFQFTDEDRKNLHDLYDLIGRIPKDASVAATETEAPHMSNRENCYTMRFGYYDAEYLLVSLDEARGGTSKEHMQQALATKQYGFMEQRGRFALWGKRQPHDRDAEGARLLGVAPAAPMVFPTPAKG